jgi:putative FmdB family regulatory protein
MSIRKTSRRGLDRGCVESDGRPERDSCRRKADIQGWSNEAKFRPYLTKSNSGIIYVLGFLFTEVKYVPIYEYQCTKCGEIFEAFQKITDEPVSQCKFCNSRVEQIISHSNFQLKGSGWYLTDYAKRSTSPANTDASKTSESSEKSSETKSSTAAASTATTSESKT